MQRLCKDYYKKNEEREIKVLQFGEGNFLRAFVDEMIDQCNEKGFFNGDIVIVKPRESGNLNKFHEQDNLYTVSLKGIRDGVPGETRRIVTSVRDSILPESDYEKLMGYACLDSLRFIVSNTTEAGIVINEEDSFDDMKGCTFPGKLTKVLYERYLHFEGDRNKGIILLPVELIDNNGEELYKCVKAYVSLWKLDSDFDKWIDEACIFCSTLVDRIVSGYPKTEEAERALFDELGYEDRLYVEGEPFGLWVIESKEDISSEFPLDKAKMPVVFTKDHKPYKKRKVRILNGAHTSFVLASFLMGNDIVLESMQDDDVYKFMRGTLTEEVIPALKGDEAELTAFADAVVERFKNPYVKHALLSISLNSVSKWKARCLPSVLDYYKEKNELPERLTFSLAALMAFYSSKELAGDCLIGTRDGEKYEIHDDMKVLEFFGKSSGKDAKVFVREFLEEGFLGTEILDVEGFVEKVSDYLEEIRKCGMRETVRKHF